MSRVMVELKQENHEKLMALSQNTGKTSDQLVNEAIESLAAPADWDERNKFLEWREAMKRVAGIWADRDDLPDFDEIRRSMDRDVWSR